MQVCLLHICKYYWKWIVISVLLQVTTINAFSERVDCLESSCYYLDNSLKKWSEANETCQNKSGHLLTILDKFEQNLITYRLSLQIDKYWIGLSEYGTPNKMTWVNSEPITYANWNIGQPINGYDTLSITGNDSAVTYCTSVTTGTNSGYWEVEPCDKEYFSICEVPRTLVEPTLINETVDSLGCAINWRNFTEFCYQFFNIPLSWSNSQAYCYHIGGNLVSINSAEEEAFLFRLARNEEERWIGLTSFNKTHEHYVWVDDIPFIYKNWNKNQPSDDSGLGYCAAEIRFNNYQKWYSRNCEIHKPFTCKMKQGIIPNPTTPPPPPANSTGDHLCQDSSWKYYNGYCYFFKLAKVSWQKASQSCRQNNSQLVSIESQDKLHFLFQLFNERATPDTERVWIGLNSLNADNFTWTNGQTFNYSNWAAGEPNNDDVGEKCAVLITISGAWFDVNCAFEANYLCQKPLNSLVSLPPTQVSTIPCPINWFEAENHCYMIFWKPDHQRTWAEALKFCHSMGKNHDLASVVDGYEQDLLITLMKEYKVNMWIGKRNYGPSYRWKYWSDNSDGTFLNWDKGDSNYKEEYSSPGIHLFNFPHKYTKEEDPDIEDSGHCVKMRTFGYHAGTWSVYNCQAPLSFICKRPRDAQSSMVPYDDPPPQPEKVNCPSEYQSYGNACFKLHLTPKSWYAAEEECKKESAELTSINNVYEGAFTRLLVRKGNVTAWIGLTNNKHKYSFDWSDGWPVLYYQFAFAVRYMTNLSTQKLCFAIDILNNVWNNGWNSFDCNKTLPFICKQSKDLPPALPLPSIGECPKDEPYWVDTGANCFLLKMADQLAMSWGSASSFCKILGFELASFDNEAEYNYVKNYTTQITSKLLWIGLYRTIHGDFVWSDKSAFNFKEWDKSFPSEHDPGSSSDMGCVVMNSWGKWRNIYCDHYLGFICKMSKSKTPETTTLKPSTDKTEKSSSTVKKGTQGTNVNKSNNESLKKQNDSGLSVGGIFGICIFVLLSVVIIGVATVSYQRRDRLPKFTDNPRLFLHTLCHSADDDNAGLPDNMEHPK